MKAKKLFLAGALACSTLTAPMMTMLNATPVFAETVTVEKNEGENFTRKYNAYQVFTGTSSGGTLVNIGWASDLSEDTINSIVNQLKTAGIVTGDTVTAEDVADALTKGTTTEQETKAKTFATILNGLITEDSNPFGAADYEIEAGTGSTFDKPGYYLLVDATDYSGMAKPNPVVGLSVLKVLGINQQINIKPKNDKPTVDKEVQDDTNEGDQHNDENGWGETADHEIGETVNFRLTATVDWSAIENYKTYELAFKDTMSAGITYKNDAKVYISNIIGEGETARETNRREVTARFTITPTQPTAEDPTTKLSVSTTDLINILESTEKTGKIKIVVEYTGELNEKAIVNDKGSSAIGNKNTVYLEYSNNPNGEGKGETKEDHVFVATYKLPGTKYDEKNDKLAGATFVLRKGEGANAKYATFKTENGVKLFDKWVDNKPADNETDATKVLTSDENGDFSVAGLDEGTFYLEEIKAPAGYNKLTDPIVVTISADHNEDTDEQTATTVVTFTKDGETAANGVEVANKKGSTLPETGGMGTTMLYTAGGVLVAGAALFFVTNKRMKKEED